MIGKLLLTIRKRNMNSVAKIVFGGVIGYHLKKNMIEANEDGMFSEEELEQAAAAAVQEYIDGDLTVFTQEQVNSAVQAGIADYVANDDTIYTQAQLDEAVEAASTETPLLNPPALMFASKLSSIGYENQQYTNNNPRPAGHRILVTVNAEIPDGVLADGLLQCRLFVVLPDETTPDIDFTIDISQSVSTTGEQVGSYIITLPVAIDSCFFYPQEAIDIPVSTRPNTIVRCALYDLDPLLTV